MYAKSCSLVSLKTPTIMANDEFDALNALEKEAKEYDKVSGIGTGE